MTTTGAAAGGKQPFDWENSTENLKTIRESIRRDEQAAVSSGGMTTGDMIGSTRPATLRERLARDRSRLLAKREELDEKIIRINGLINDIDRDPGLGARYDELLTAVMSDKGYLFRPTPGTV